MKYILIIIILFLSSILHAQQFPFIFYNPTDAGVPEQVTLVDPTDGETNIAITGTLFDWNDAVGATGYYFEIDDNSDFSSVDYSSSPTSSSKTYDGAGLLEDHRYYWKARGTNGAGNGAWSVVWSFYTTAGSSIARKYYVDATAGNDDWNGRSSAKAWQTIAEVNGRTLIAGDTVVFKGGETWTGILDITQSGNASNQIIFSSYGTGKAKFLSTITNQYQIVCVNQQYITIKNIKCKGLFNPYSQGGQRSNEALSGVYFLNTGSGKLKNIIIDSVHVSNYAGRGIYFTSYNADSNLTGGFEDLQVINCRVDSIGHEGIVISWATPAVSYAGYYPLNNAPQRQVTIRNNEVSRVTGLLETYVGGTFQHSAYTGNGIYITNCDTLWMDHNLVYDCGGVAPDTAGSSTDALEIITVRWGLIESNEVRNQQTIGSDGAGIHLEGGCKFNIIEKNYVRACEGGGISIYSSTAAPYNDTLNTIRYNIVEANGLIFNGETSAIVGTDITVSSDGTHTHYNTSIYNNTFYTKRLGTDGKTSCLGVGGLSSNLLVANNIFYAADSSTACLYVTISANQTGMKVLNNCYWNAKYYMTINENSVEYHNLEAWQNAHTERETLGVADVYYNYNPFLNRAGQNLSVNNPYELDTLRAYHDTLATMMNDNGLNLTQAPYSLSVGTTDFYGQGIPDETYFDIGAYENYYASNFYYQDSCQMFLGKTAVMPSAAMQLKYDSLYKMLQDSSILRLERALYCFATTDTTLAFRNLKIDTTYGFRIGGMAWTSLEGITGASGDYFNTNLNIKNNSLGIYSLNDVTYGIYIRTNSANDVMVDFGVSTDNETTRFGSRKVGDVSQYYINSLTLITGDASVTDSRGYWTLSRLSSTASIVYYNGATSGSEGVSNSILLEDYYMVVGAVGYSGGNFSFSDRQYSWFTIGKYHDATQQRKLKNIIEWWQDSNGKGVIP